VKRHCLIAATLLTLFLTTYLLVEALHVGLLVDPQKSLPEPRWAAGAIGVSLLVADQFVPVASSLVMISLGALYGVGGGIALSLIGRTGMMAAGFGVGRAGGPLLDRLCSAAERARADAFFARRGALAILISRPVPLLAETVAIVAGTSRMRWSRALLAAALGSLPEAVAYSLAGAVSPSFENAAMIWGSFLVVAGGFWFLGRWIERRAAASDRGQKRPSPQPRISRGR
jgi:uncharacterized membrane protein YdjX (TVP38/TMEM64 family)